MFPICLQANLEDKHHQQTDSSTAPQQADQTSQSEANEDTHDRQDDSHSNQNDKHQGVDGRSSEQESQQETQQETQHETQKSPLRSCVIASAEEDYEMAGQRLLPDADKLDTPSLGYAVDMEAVTHVISSPTSPVMEAMNTTGIDADTTIISTSDMRPEASGPEVATSEEREDESPEQNSKDSDSDVSLNDSSKEETADATCNLVEQPAASNVLPPAMDVTDGDEEAERMKYDIPRDIPQYDTSLDTSHDMSSRSADIDDDNMSDDQMSVDGNGDGDVEDDSSSSSDDDDDDDDDDSSSEASSDEEHNQNSHQNNHQLQEQPLAPTHILVSQR